MAAPLAAPLSQKPMKLPTARTLKGLHLAALLMLATAAQAQAAPASAPDANAQKGRHAHQAMKLDTNKDGQLSREEVKGHARLEKAFDKIDSNGDGQISREEMAAARNKMREHGRASQTGAGV